MSISIVRSSATLFSVTGASTTNSHSLWQGGPRCMSRHDCGHFDCMRQLSQPEHGKYWGSSGKLPGNPGRAGREWPRTGNSHSVRSGSTPAPASSGAIGREAKLTPRAAAVLAMLVERGQDTRHQAGIVRPGLGRSGGQRRRADLLHPGAAGRARRRRPPAALHRDPAPARLPADGAGREGDRNQCNRLRALAGASADPSKLVGRDAGDGGACSAASTGRCRAGVRSCS